MNDWFIEQLNDELKIAIEAEAFPNVKKEYWQGVRFGIRFALETYFTSIKQGHNKQYNALKAYQESNRCHNDLEAKLFQDGYEALGE